MSKYIFLDIDGTLNSNRSNDDLEQDCIERLNKIVEATNARIVISSDWRINFENRPEWLFEMLMDAGIVNAFYDITTCETKPRWQQILEWIQDAELNDNDRIIILDDIDDFACLNEYLVHTSMATGLTDADVEKAIKILNKTTEEK